MDIEMKIEKTIDFARSILNNAKEEDLHKTFNEYQKENNLPKNESELD